MIASRKMKLQRTNERLMLGMAEEVGEGKARINDVRTAAFSAVAVANLEAENMRRPQKQVCYVTLGKMFRVSTSCSVSHRRLDIRAF